MKNVLLLYPNQLFAVEELPKDVDQIILVEEPLLFGKDQQYPMYVHRQKLVFMRATMRRYIEDVLWPAGFNVDYVEFHHMNETGDIVNKLTHFEEVLYFDLTDDVLDRRLQAAVAGLEHQPSIHVLESPNFFLKRAEVESFFAKTSKSDFTAFYRWQRERFNILINPDTYKPVGGKLSYENETRKRLPKNHKLPSFQVYGSNDFVKEAKGYVAKHFPENPGSVEDFPWPTNHKEAEQWLQEFLDHRIDHFGPYQDAIDGHAPWIYHSGISPLLNSGLLEPQKVVQAALDRHERKPVPMASLETFIRQVLGWREYVRGAYLKRGTALRTGNVFNHTRRMTADWYNGTTGLPPVDDVINKVKSRSYAHNVERLMVLQNIMFLCEFHPDEVYRWFMEMFVDAYDWNTVPNVYGTGQFAAGNVMVSKPTSSSSNYILKMSHYERGEWCNIWDGLYWRFIENNQEKFGKDPHMRITVGQLKKLPEERMRIMGYRAEDFLNEKTISEQNEVAET